MIMIVLVFFCVVILFSLALNGIDKIRSYNNEEDRSIWQDGDSVVVKPKDSPGMTGGFGRRLGESEEMSGENKAS